jgi:hypothetical protein
MRSSAVYTAVVVLICGEAIFFVTGEEGER